MRHIHTFATGPPRRSSSPRRTAPGPSSSRRSPRPADAATGETCAPTRRPMSLRNPHGEIAGCLDLVSLKGRRMIEWRSPQRPEKCRIKVVSDWQEPTAASMNRRSDLLRFYALLERLEQKAGGMRTLTACSGRIDWPRRGVYFFLEDGERRSDTGQGLWIVRIGTPCAERELEDNSLEPAAAAPGFRQIRRRQSQGLDLSSSGRNGDCKQGAPSCGLDMGSG